MKWKLISAFFGITFLILIVQDVPLVRYLRTVETERINTSLERDGFIIAGRSKESLESLAPEDLNYISNVLVDYSQISGARVVVTDANGVVVAASDTTNSVGKNFANRPEVATALKGSVATGARFSTTLSMELMYVAVPILSGRETIGTVRLTFPASAVDQIINTRLRGIILVAGLTLTFATLVGLFLALSISRRLTNLRKVTDEFAQGDLQVRANATTGESEIRALASSFNLMADRIERLVSEQRAFAGDASHQLRTPLTALRLRLERSLEMLESDPTGVAQRLEAAMVETDRLQRLVEELLILSRSDNSENIPREILDASLIARERIDYWVALASENDIALALDVPESANILALPGVLEQILDNYVDNALEVVPTGSIITVKILVAGEMTKISIIDQGPGIAEADLPKAFNRFWRARSDSHGSGLGLAIVERLTVASGGHAELINLEPTGLSANAYFPTA